MPAEDKRVGDEGQRPDELDRAIRAITRTVADIEAVVPRQMPELAVALQPTVRVTRAVRIGDPVPDEVVDLADAFARFHGRLVMHGERGDGKTVVARRSIWRRR